MNQLAMMFQVGLLELLVLLGLGLGTLGVLFVVVYYAVKAAQGQK